MHNAGRTLECLIQLRLNTLRKMGGFLKRPTPGGVPVRTTSPGLSVKNLRGKQTQQCFIFMCREQLQYAKTLWWLQKHEHLYHCPEWYYSTLCIDHRRPTKCPHYCRWPAAANNVSAQRAKQKICVRQFVKGQQAGRVSKWTYCEIQATSAAVLKIIWLVLLLWTSSPLTRQRRARLWGSTGEEVMCDISTFSFYKIAVTVLWFYFIPDLQCSRRIINYIFKKTTLTLTLCH